MTQLSGEKKNCLKYIYHGIFLYFYQKLKIYESN